MCLVNIKKSQSNMIVILYYGLSGHRNSFVNAMSAFSMKGLLLKAVITDNFKYNSAKGIYQYMKEFFKEDSPKIYFHVTPEEIVHCRCEEIKPVPIPGCVKESHHMIYFKSDRLSLPKLTSAAVLIVWKETFWIVVQRKEDLLWLGTKQRRMTSQMIVNQSMSMMNHKIQQMMKQSFMSYEVMLQFKQSNLAMPMYYFLWQMPWSYLTYARLQNQALQNRIFL